MGSARLLVVVAHPDDETFGCGSLLLHAAAAGVTTSVCCATRGEEGEPKPGSGVPREHLGDERERELRAAAEVLGVDRVELLGYRDSGMQGPAREDALVSAPLRELTARIAEVLDRLRPHVVVTLAADDGHRDHVHVRDATVASLQRASWPVQRLYLQCLPRAALRRWADHERARHPDRPYLDVDDVGLGTRDEDLTTVVDTSAHLDARRAAIRCHRSQSSPFADLPPDLERAFLATEHLIRVRPGWNGGAIETQVFDDLDLFLG